jgi:hypothetical protein
MEKSSALNYVTDHPKLAAFIACVAIAITFTPKASVMATWVSLLIAWAFAVGMVAGLPVVKGAKWGSLATGAAAAMLIVVLFLFGRWLTDLKTGASPLVSVRSIGAHAIHWLNDPWPQRIICIALGMVLFPLLQLSKRTIITYRSREAAGRDRERGTLDYKLQAEIAIERLPNVLAPIAEILVQVGRTMDEGTLRVKAVLSSPTTMQLREIRRTAKELDRHTRNLDLRCDDLEKVGEDLSQGISGWLSTMRLEQRRAASQHLEDPLRTLVDRLVKSSAITEGYLHTILGLTGVSQDMNEAARLHAKGIMRIREATAKIRQSCGDSLLLLQE